MSDLCKRVLSALADGEPAKRKAVIDRMIAAGLPVAGAKIMGGWPFNEALRRGFVRRPQRGVYQTTDAGRAALNRM